MIKLALTSTLAIAAPFILVLSFSATASKHSPSKDTSPKATQSALAVQNLNSQNRSR